MIKKSDYFAILVLLFLFTSEAYIIHTVPDSYKHINRNTQKSSIGLMKTLYYRKPYTESRKLPTIQGEFLLYAEKENNEVYSKGDLTKSYIALGTLLAIFTSNQWSRQALYYLCDFSGAGNSFTQINVDLNFDKDAYATLASLGFTVFFTLFSFVAGRVSDRFNRINIMSLSCLTWGVFTALHSMASSYSDLIPLRAIVGASQAFFNPAAYTLIADIFPPQLVGTVNGIFSSGIYLGGAMASLSILLDNNIGWRQTMTVVGGSSIIMAALLKATLSETRDSSNVDIMDVDKVSISKSEVIFEDFNLKNTIQSGLDSVKEVLKTKDAKIIYFASAVRFAAGFSIAIWKAPFIFAKFPASESLFAGSNAFIVAVGGLLSSLIGGYISDYVANPKEGENGISRCWIPAVGSLLAVPLWAGFILSDDPKVSLIFLFAEYLVAECWFGPTLASIFNIVPATSRGTSQALFSILIAVGNLGPVLVASLVEGLAMAPLTLQTALLVTVSFMYFISGLLFSIAAIEEDKRIKQ